MGENIWLVTSLLVAGVMFLMFMNRIQRPRSSMKWPPGPLKLPLVGNLHQLGKSPHLTLAQMAKQYGPMMTIWFGGSKPTVVVNSLDAVWEVLVTKTTDYGSWPLTYILKWISAEWKTTATSNLGEHWKSLRKGLQGFAMNPSAISMQTQSQESDVIAMIRTLREEASANNGVGHPLIHIRRNTVRLMSRLCFGPDFDDEAFVEGIDNAVEENIELFRQAGILESFPIARLIPGFGLPLKESREFFRRVELLISPQISRYGSSDCDSLNASCFLHFLLSQNYSRDIVIANVLELFVLSVDSTAVTTAWALAFLIHNQEAQQKLYKEVGSGEREMVTVEQLSKMQYVHAVVKETMRMKPIAPLAIPHKTAKDTTLMGQKIDQGTEIITNLYAVLNDPAVWDEPERFMPEQFLNKHERSEAMERSLVSFGAGRLVCVRMEVAKLHVALTLANLVKKFEWRSVDGVGPDMSDEFAFVLLLMKTPVVAHVVSRP